MSERVGMARPLRVNVAGGWHRLMARGQNLRHIYAEARKIQAAMRGS